MLFSGRFMYSGLDESAANVCGLASLFPLLLSSGLLISLERVEWPESLERRVRCVAAVAPVVSAAEVGSGARVVVARMAPMAAAA